MPTGTWIYERTSTTPGGGGPPPSLPAPPDVEGITITHAVMNNATGAFTITVTIDPPSPLGSFAGGHVYLEIPDQSASGGGATVGITPVGSSSPLTGDWAYLDLGMFPYQATSPRAWIVRGMAPPGVDIKLAHPSRLYVASFSAAIDNPLKRAGTSGATPNETFTLMPEESGAPSSGSGVTTTSGPIVAQALSPDNSTGKLKTPVLVMVSSVPNTIEGWCYQIVTTWDDADPTVPENQFVMTGVMKDPGPVYAGEDGIAVPHTFVVDTPTEIHDVVVWLQSGLADATGLIEWNDIVPGITPSFPIKIGTNNGTTDATQFMTATIAETMAVVSGMFGIAPLGVTNPYLGSGAVHTLNIENLAITNPLLANLVVNAAKLADLAVETSKLVDSAVVNAKLASLAVAADNILDLAISSGKLQDDAVTNAKLADLAVDAVNLIDSAVTTTKIANAAVGTAAIAALAVGTGAIQALAVAFGKIANLAVGTAAIQLLAVDSSIIANLAVGGAKIVDLAVTGAKIANATIATANLGSLIVTTANIADLAVTQAKIDTIRADQVLAGLLSGHTLVVTTSTPSGNVTTSVQVQGGFQPVPNTYSGIRISDVSGNWSGMSSLGVGAFNNTCFGILFADALQLYKVISPSAGTNSVAIRLGTTGGNTPELWFNGIRILREQYSPRPTDAASIIACLVYHGLCA